MSGAAPAGCRGRDGGGPSFGNVPAAAFNSTEKFSAAQAARLSEGIALAREAAPNHSPHGDMQARDRQSYLAADLAT